jgi:hypothetical protein
MQFPSGAKPPVGIVFDSGMNRIDDVLALAMLHGFDGKEEARIAAVTISTPSLEAAQFCDAVRAFYASATTGMAAIFAHHMPVGLADGKPAASLPLWSAPLANNETSVKNLNDTAEVTTLIRNSLMAYDDQNAAVVLSGPATDLAQLLDMYGVRDLIARKVKVLCVVEEAGVAADIASARKVFAEWPGPIVAVGREIGAALPFPAESIERDFAWSPAHPVVEAYRAYKPMPYDAPSGAMAALLYAVRDKEGYFRLSPAGTIAVLPDGRTTLTESDGGKHHYLVLDPDQKERIIQTYIEMASMKPIPRKMHHLADDKKDEKKDEKKKEDLKL